MNETLQKIMLFINEHTLLLIGICVFLILVLIGYLIDNSVKSKRVRKDIKNADQVPENIKDEIIKEAEEKQIKKEDVKVEETPVVTNEENNMQPVVNNEQNELNGSLNLDSSNTVDTNINQGLNLESSNQTEPVIGQELNLNPTASVDNNQEFILNSTPSTLETPFNLDVQTEDPDAKIMTPISEYKNDKSLSDILKSVKEENVNNVEINNDFNNIFGDNSSDIVINNDVKKDDVQIENNNSSDELDRIMRKLSTMNNNVEEDNYTNIF